MAVQRFLRRLARFRRLSGPRQRPHRVGAALEMPPGDTLSKLAHGAFSEVRALALAQTSLESVVRLAACVTAGPAQAIGSVKGG